MTESLAWRPAPSSIPESPGTYRFWDGADRVIYVGKAKSLRPRVSSYFTGPAGRHPRTQALLTAAVRVDWFATTTEVEALQLEYAWIKEFTPRFNVRYRDDKSYPFLAVTMGEEYPRVLVTRARRSPRTRVFGPYPHAWAIRETTDQLQRVFGVRSCSDVVMNRHRLLGRPCLLGDIGRCAAPCIDRVDAAEHRRLAEGFCQVMAGGAEPHLRRLRSEMDAAAAELAYERAARLRDQVAALSRVVERNSVVLADGVDADVIAVAGDELSAAVRVLHIRGGRIRGERSHVVDRGATGTDGELIRAMLVEIYADGGDPPPTVLTSVDPMDESLTAWLTGQRGGRVAVRVPRRGNKAALMAMAADNAAAALASHRLRRAGDLTLRSQALAELQTTLTLAEAPLRIEAIDISQHAGDAVVASLVVFEDGLPLRSAYRSYTIAGPATDDLSGVREVVRRRFTGTAAGRYPPGLLVVDGGPAQAAAAAAELERLGVSAPPVVGLAKRLEEVWPAGAADPVILPRTSEGLYLLQRIRDEAHRRAHRHHGRRRSADLRVSVLAEVPGVGPARRARLLAHFGSVAAIARANPEEIARVPGIGPDLASRIRDVAAGAMPGPADG